MSILLIEDNPNDVELAVHAFKTHNLANRIDFYWLLLNKVPADLGKATFV